MNMECGRVGARAPDYILVSFLRTYVCMHAPIVSVEGQYPQSGEPLDLGGVVAACTDGGQLRCIQLQPLLPYGGQRPGEVLRG